MKEKQTDSLEIFKSAPISLAVLKKHNSCHGSYDDSINLQSGRYIFYRTDERCFHDCGISSCHPGISAFHGCGNCIWNRWNQYDFTCDGEGRKEYAKKVCSFCMWSCVIAGVIMVIVILVFMDSILKMLGASADTMKYARQYLSIVTVAGPFVLISNCYANIIRTEGKAGMAMMGQLGGNLLNVILDPILISGFCWNVTGAAIATTVSNLVSAAYYIGYFKSGKSRLSISPKDFSVGSCLQKAAYQGKSLDFLW